MAQLDIETSIREIQRNVLAQMDFSEETTDEQVLELIEEQAGQYLSAQYVGLRERDLIEKSVFHALRRLDVIQELIDNPDVTEIMVNGPNRIFYEKDGQIMRLEKQFLSEEKLSDVIQKIVGVHNRVVNLSNPIVDTRLPDGSRVNIVLSPISLDGSAITIRKFPRYPMTMERLLKLNSISKEAADFLAELVRCGYSIVVAGGTGSGKTTFLNALSSFIPKTERVITIEDSAELQLVGIDNLVRLETRNANIEQVSEIAIRDLIRTALRMRPDRIIVGECRGGEAFDMLQAMNTGHDGSLSTGHANSCRDMLSRLEMMVRMGMDLPLEAIRAQIASGVDIIVHLSRMEDRSRKVQEIVELDGIVDGEIRLNSLFRREDSKLVAVGSLKNKEKWRQNGS